MVHLKNQNWGPPGGVCVGCVALGFQSVKCLGSTKDHRLVLGRIIPSVSRAVCGKHQDFFFLSWNFCLYFPSWKILSETVDGLFQRIPRDSYLQGPWEHKSIGVVIAGSSWRTFPSTHPLGSLHCLVLPDASGSLICPASGSPLWPAWRGRTTRVVEGSPSPCPPPPGGWAFWFSTTQVLSVPDSVTSPPASMSLTESPSLPYTHSYTHSNHTKTLSSSMVLICKWSDGCKLVIILALPRQTAWILIP